MQITDIPGKFTYPFASGASGSFIRNVPPTSVDPDAASEYLGFPSATFTPTASGGVAPDGRDFNGILNTITGWNQWQQAGGPITYDSVFQAAVGGYPKGAIVQSATVFGKLWMSTADNNVTDPDASGPGWTAWTFGSVGSGTVTSITAGTGLSGGTITGAGTITLRQASVSQLGGVKVDGTSIIISGSGVISSTTGGSGSVNSVGLDAPAIFTVSGTPVTTTGTLTLALATQAANRIWGGPVSGSAAAPTFRALVPLDLPVATSAQRGAVQVDNVTTFMTGSVISAAASAPPVSSVSGDGAGTGLTLTGGPTGAVTLLLGGVLNLNFGGTGATTPGGARTALQLGTMATQNSNNVSITGGGLSGVTLTAPNISNPNFTTAVTIGTLNNTTIATTFIQSSGQIIATVGSNSASLNGTGVVVATQFVNTPSVSSSASVLSLSAGGGSGNASLNSSGTFTCVTLVQTSDARRKMDVERVGSRGLDAIRQLAGYTFTMREGGTRSAGVMAQELEAILPDLVTQDTAGFKAVNYSGLWAYSIEAHKEIDAEQQSMLGRLDALEARLAA